MSEWQIVLLTGVVTVVTSIVTALITLSITHRNEVKKLVLEKREELYFEFYEEVEQLLQDNQKVYDASYIDILLKFKPKMKLLSSVKTVAAFKSLFEFVTRYRQEYVYFCDKNDPREDPQHIVTEFNEDGVEYEFCAATDMEIAIFEEYAEKYMKENAPSVDTINHYITALYTEMRNDLGSNMK